MRRGKKPNCLGGGGDGGGCGGGGGGGCGGGGGDFISDQNDSIFHKIPEKFGRDTAKNEYFNVSPFSVHGDDRLIEINGSGGGYLVLPGPKLVGAEGTTRSVWWKNWFSCWHGRK
ncbi:hypothetical protein R6Q59_034495 [Mikania micrantha]